MSETKATTARAALIRAQAQMGAAKKDSKNPHFNSAYADLASVAEALHGPFADNGLGWRHEAWSDAEGVYVLCIIFHESGDEIRPEKPLFLPIPKKDPQAYKSGVTYGKRTTLEAAAGVSTDDDDGNAASAQAVVAAPPPAAQAARSAQKLAQREPTEGERMEAEEPPHPAGQETISPGVVFGPVIPFGKDRGKRASESTAHNLDWLIKAVSASIDDPTKKKYQANNMRLLDGLLEVREAKYGPMGTDA